MKTWIAILSSIGMFAIALAVRYRKKPSLWAYLAFLVIAVVCFTLNLSSSPLVGAIPLMLSFVLIYIDEQRQKRAALSMGALAAGTKPAEPGASPNNGPATPTGNSGVTEGPPWVS